MKSSVYARTIESATGSNADTQAALSVGLFRAIGWLENVVADCAQAFARRRARANTIRELRALDDRLLADIGIERGRIPDVVDSLLAYEREPREPPPERAPASGAHLGA